MTRFALPPTVPKSVFRAYDVRGVVPDDLNESVVYAIGRAIGSEARACQQTTMVVGRDGRLSGPSLFAALCAGLLESGIDLIDIGQVPSPLLYFATHTLSTNSGVILTGSHNPKNYNGLKIVLDGKTLIESQVQRLYQRIESADFVSGEGRLSQQDIVGAYIDAVCDRVQLQRPLKVVVDCGNGVGGVVLPVLYERLECEVVPLYCEVDGSFPNHHPNPGAIENLQDLLAAVNAHQADIGLAFDGDADRLGVVTPAGKIIWPDRQLIVFARDLLSRHPEAEIVFDVKCSAHLAREIERAGGKPVMWKTGHSLVKAKMLELGALLAGEMSGHLFFKENWYGFDDGLYAGACLLRILAESEGSVDDLFDAVPDSVNTPELNIAVADAEKFALMEKLTAVADFADARLLEIDGVRAEYADGWGLVRVSNTTPCLTLRFEADNPDALARIQAEFKAWLLAVDPGLEVPFS